MELLRRLRAAPPPAPPPPPVAAPRSSSRTHVGLVRQVNEDRVLALPERGLWAVADGMGGQSRGDVAADTVVKALARLEAPVAAADVARAIDEANRDIYTALGGQSGTTLVLLQLSGTRATVWWIGDSRAYLIRDANARLLTRDHSLVQELVEAGAIDARQATTHPQANVITRAVGIAPQAQPDRLSLELHPGDRILLCSDGLSRTFAESDFADRLSVADEVERLLADALARDGSDNTSLVLVEV